jgi:hypothetical protein
VREGSTKAVKEKEEPSVDLLEMAAKRWVGHHQPQQDEQYQAQLRGDETFFIPPFVDVVVADYEFCELCE